MDTQLILYAILFISVLTSLTTEAIKKLIAKENRADNIIAAICSIVLATLVCIGYCLYIEQPFTIQIIIEIIAISFISLLCAVCGYDKVIQTLKQVKEKNNESNKRNSYKH